MDYTAASILKNKIILITGGTGAFGNAIIAHGLTTGASEIRVISRDEKKQEDMRIALSDPRVKFFIGDVRSIESLNDAVRGCDFVFHAAAMTHPASCDLHPLETIRTNVLGAANVMDAVSRQGVKRALFFSTFMAVYPTTTLGLSKALMERLVAAKSRRTTVEGTALLTVRLGTVVSSQDSLIPQMIRQIKSGNPISIPDPDTLCFLLTPVEAIELVLHALSFGEEGDIWVRKTPACTLRILAESLLEIFDGTSEIRVFENKRCERLPQSLVSVEEIARAAEDEHYLRIPAQEADIQVARFARSLPEARESLRQYTSIKSQRLKKTQVVSLLLAEKLIQDALHI